MPRYRIKNKISLHVVPLTFDNPQKISDLIFLSAAAELNPPPPKHPRPNTSTPTKMSAVLQRENNIKKSDRVLCTYVTMINRTAKNSLCLSLMRSISIISPYCLNHRLTDLLTHSFITHSRLASRSHDFGLM